MLVFIKKISLDYIKLHVVKVRMEKGAVVQNVKQEFVKIWLKTDKYNLITARKFC